MRNVLCLSSLYYRRCAQKLEDLCLRVIEVRFGDISLVLDNDLIVDSGSLALIDDGTDVAHASVDLDEYLP